MSVAVQIVTMVSTVLAPSSTFAGKAVVCQKKATRSAAARRSLAVRAGAYDEELVQTAVSAVWQLAAAPCSRCSQSLWVPGTAFD